MIYVISDEFDFNNIYTYLRKKKLIKKFEEYLGLK